jgi:Expansin C-terminal domain
LTFRIDSGSNPYYLAVLVEYQAGEGDMSLLEVMPDAGSGNWYPMVPSWGAVWKYQGTSSMPGPFSFRVTTGSGKTLVAENAVPAGWQPGSTYTSTVNFVVNTI